MYLMKFIIEFKSIILIFFVFLQVRMFLKKLPEN